MTSQFVYSILGNSIKCNRELSFFLPIDTKTLTNGTIKFEPSCDDISYPANEAAKCIANITQSDGLPVFKIYEYQDYLLVIFIGKASFRIDKKRFDILVTAQSKVSDKEIDLLLFGPITSLAAEMSGFICLHASTVIHKTGEAICFLGHQRAGKTTITASLALETDFMLLSDDVTIVEMSMDQTIIHSMHSHMKLWPDSAKHLMETEDYPVVHRNTIKRSVMLQESFSSTASTKLSKIYLLEPNKTSQGTQIETVTLPPKEAFIELLNHSYANRVLTMLELDKERMSKLAMLANRSSVIKLSYAHNYNLLPNVIDFIRNEI